MAATGNSEGDILRRLRIAKTNAERKNLLAHLPSSKTQSKQTLVKSLDSWPLYLIRCLDDLIPFPGLWSDVKLIGNMVRLNGLNMPEVGLNIKQAST
jgi:hypothetical protein